MKDKTPEKAVHTKSERKLTFSQNTEEELTQQNVRTVAVQHAFLNKENL
jgi:hypothetical protein